MNGNERDRLRLARAYCDAADALEDAGRALFKHIPEPTQQTRTFQACITALNKACHALSRAGKSHMTGYEQFVWERTGNIPKFWERTEPNDGGQP